MRGEGSVSSGALLEEVGYWVCDLERHLVCGLFLSLSLSWLLGEELLCSVMPFCHDSWFITDPAAATKAF